MRSSIFLLFLPLICLTIRLVSSNTVPRKGRSKTGENIKGESEDVEPSKTWPSKGESSDDEPGPSKKQNICDVLSVEGKVTTRSESSVYTMD